MDNDVEPSPPLQASLPPSQEVEAVNKASQDRLTKPADILSKNIGQELSKEETDKLTKETHEESGSHDSVNEMYGTDFQLVNNTEVTGQCAIEEDNAKEQPISTIDSDQLEILEEDTSKAKGRLDDGERNINAAKLHVEKEQATEIGQEHYKEDTDRLTNETENEPEFHHGVDETHATELELANDTDAAERDATENDNLEKQAFSTINSDQLELLEEESSNATGRQDDEEKTSNAAKLDSERNQVSEIGSEHSKEDTDKLTKEKIHESELHDSVDETHETDVELIYSTETTEPGAIVQNNLDEQAISTPNNDQLDLLEEESSHAKRRQDDGEKISNAARLDLEKEQATEVGKERGTEETEKLTNETTDKSEPHGIVDVEHETDVVLTTNTEATEQGATEQDILEEQAISTTNNDPLEILEEKSSNATGQQDEGEKISNAAEQDGEKQQATEAGSDLQQICDENLSLVPSTDPFESRVACVKDTDPTRRATGMPDGYSSEDGKNETNVEKPVENAINLPVEEIHDVAADAIQTDASGTKVTTLQEICKGKELDSPCAEEFSSQDPKSPAVGSEAGDKDSADTTDLVDLGIEQQCSQFQQGISSADEINEIASQDLVQEGSPDISPATKVVDGMQADSGATSELVSDPNMKLPSLDSASVPSGLSTPIASFAFTADIVHKSAPEIQAGLGIPEPATAPTPTANGDLYHEGRENTQNVEAISAETSAIPTVIPETTAGSTNTEGIPEFHTKMADKQSSSPTSDQSKGVHGDIAMEEEGRVLAEIEIVQEDQTHRIPQLESTDEDDASTITKPLQSEQESDQGCVVDPDIYQYDDEMMAADITLTKTASASANEYADEEDTSYVEDRSPSESSGTTEMINELGSQNDAHQLEIEESAEIDLLQKPAEFNEKDPDKTDVQQTPAENHDILNTPPSKDEESNKMHASAVTACSNTDLQHAIFEKYEVVDRQSVVNETEQIDTHQQLYEERNQMEAKQQQPEVGELDQTEAQQLITEESKSDTKQQVIDKSETTEAVQEVKYDGIAAKQLMVEESDRLDANQQVTDISEKIECQQQLETEESDEVNSLSQLASDNSGKIETRQLEADESDVTETVKQPESQESPDMLVAQQQDVAETNKTQVPQLAGVVSDEKGDPQQEEEPDKVEAQLLQADKTDKTETQPDHEVEVSSDNIPAKTLNADHSDTMQDKLPVEDESDDIVRGAQEKVEAEKADQIDAQPLEVGGTDATDVIQHQTEEFSGIAAHQQLNLHESDEIHTQQHGTDKADANDALQQSEGDESDKNEVKQPHADESDVTEPQQLVEVQKLETEESDLVKAQQQSAQEHDKTVSPLEYQGSYEIDTMQTESEKSDVKHSIDSMPSSPDTQQVESDEIGIASISKAGVKPAQTLELPTVIVTSPEGSVVDQTEHDAREGDMLKKTGTETETATENKEQTSKNLEVKCEQDMAAPNKTVRSTFLC